MNKLDGLPLSQCEELHSNPNNIPFSYTITSTTKTELTTQQIANLAITPATSHLDLQSGLRKIDPDTFKQKKIVYLPIQNNVLPPHLYSTITSTEEVRKEAYIGYEVIPMPQRTELAQLKILDLKGNLRTLLVQMSPHSEAVEVLPHSAETPLPITNYRSLSDLIASISGSDLSQYKVSNIERQALISKLKITGNDLSQLHSIQWNITKYEKNFLKQPEFSLTECLLPQNNIKNRFFDVIPFDKNRTCRDIKDFYISSSDVETPYQYYIVCQGPLTETISDSFRGSLVTGMNLLQVWMDYRSDPVSGNIKVDNCSYNSFLIDPYFRKADLSDCNAIWKRSYLTKRECISLLPDSAEIIYS